MKHFGYFPEETLSPVLRGRSEQGYESSYWDDLRSEGKSEESFKDRVEHSPPGRRTPTRTGTGKI